MPDWHRLSLNKHPRTRTHKHKAFIHCLAVLRITLLIFSLNLNPCLAALRHPKRSASHPPVCFVAVSLRVRAPRKGGGQPDCGQQECEEWGCGTDRDCKAQMKAGLRCKLLCVQLSLREGKMSNVYKSLSSCASDNCEDGGEQAGEVLESAAVEAVMRC